MGKVQEHTNFESGMREAFRDFGYAPAPDVWSRVEARLHRRRKIVLFTTLATAAAILLLFGVSGWVFYHNMMIDLTPPTVAEQVIQPVIEPESPANHSPKTSTLTTPEFQSADEPGDIPPAVADDKIMVADLVSASAPVPEDLNQESQSDLQKIWEEENESLPAEVDMKTEKNEGQEANYSTETLTLYDLTLYDDDFPAEKSKEKSWQLGLGYGTTTGGSVSDPAVSYEANSADFSEDYFSSELSAETKRFEDLENTTHSQPISVGIMANKALSKRWGLESGLLFTRLKTRATTNPENNSYTEYVSEILYLGIPLTVRFSIINGRRFGLYASQGLVLEKGIKTWYSTNSYSSGVLTGSQTSSYTVEGVQLSSLTSLGVDYKLGDLISIYLQPGFQVFFLNETQPYNIRSSSPYWPSVQTGLRFQL